MAEEINVIELPSGEQYNIADTTARKAMTGATETTDGTQGQVPAPTKADINKFFRSDGTWADIPKYEIASATEDGLMSTVDKNNLDSMTEASQDEVTTMVDALFNE